VAAREFFSPDSLPAAAFDAVGLLIGLLQDHLPCPAGDKKSIDDGAAASAGKATTPCMTVVGFNSGMNEWKKLGTLEYFGQDENIAGQAFGERLNRLGAKHALCHRHAVREVDDHHETQPGLIHRPGGDPERPDRADGNPVVVRLRQQGRGRDRRRTSVSQDDGSGIGPLLPRTTSFGSNTASRGSSSGFSSRSTAKRTAYSAMSPAS